MRLEIFFFAGGAVLTALAVRYADKPWLWDGTIYVGAAVMAFSILDFLVRKAAPRRNLKMFSIVGMIVCGLGFMTCFLWYFDNNGLEQVNDLPNDKQVPIATSQILAPNWKGKALFDSDPGKDLPVLLLEDIFIKNTSLTKTLTMKIQLHADMGRSQYFDIEATGLNDFGKVLGKNDYGTSIIKRKLGEVPPDKKYILSPVTIKPQEIIRGQIPFVLRFFTKEQLETIECGALTRLGTGCSAWKYALKFVDVISGNETMLRLPGKLLEK
jgi:hypothetical protein